MLMGGHKITKEKSDRGIKNNRECISKLTPLLDFETLPVFWLRLTGGINHLSL